MPSDSWLSWPQAAGLVGCPVPTIEWYARTGRIRRRPQAGSRPSLERESVEEFGIWWRERELAKRARREARTRSSRRQTERAEQLGIPEGRLANAGDAGWMTSNSAAEALGVSTSTVLRMVRADELVGEKIGQRWLIRAERVQALADERSQWVSMAQAAAVVGCAETTIQMAVKRGEIEQRVAHRTTPSLSRRSVEEYREARAKRALERAQRRKPSGPPDDDHVWLDSRTAGLVLGIGASRVRQLAEGERLPGVRRPGRWWFRRDHVEQCAAARAFVGRA